MADYQRIYVPGGTYFFTVVTADRTPWLTTDAGRSILSEAMRNVRRDQPFETVACVLLPDHLHVDVAGRRCGFLPSLAPHQATGIDRYAEKYGARGPVSGNRGSGTTGSGMTRIFGSISITSITIRSSMDSSRHRSNGRRVHSIGSLRGASIRPIRVAMLT